ncbi:PIN domain-like protein [Mycena filopes]|nr:PIN domain-like protein [Mycena filopes]
MQLTLCSPAVVKQLPDRLRGLAGKKIVIDGTLITQRLHFAQVPHDYRHVLGWYRLVKELEDSGVSAICVFDGKERSVAKAREVERRREVKRLAVARGSIELDRVKRLDRLVNVMDRFQALDAVEKGRVAEQLKEDDRKSTPSISNESLPPSTPSTQEHASLPARSQPTEEQSSSPPEEPEKSASPPASSPAPSSAQPPPSPAPSSPLLSPPPTVSPLERPFPVTHVPEASDSAAPEKLASLTPARPPRAADFADKEEQQEARVEYSMTKTQIQLMADEAKLWEELTVPSAAPADPADEMTRTPEETLAELSFRANMMSESYERRNNPPTTQTYEESKELLRAMGVPCIDTTGTYEAEALASSMVINGFADFVASEDTDVVVYEAPLLRNITNRKIPLVMLVGSEIRNALQLDRSSFIDFALLLGTDFSQRIKNVGPVRALKFIRQHKSIERVIEVETKYEPRVPPPAYLAEVELGRLVFQTLPPVPDVKLLEQEKDEEGLQIVLQRFGLGKLLMAQEEWVFEDALQGNYFSDDPSASSGLDT